MIRHQLAFSPIVSFVNAESIGQVLSAFFAQNGSTGANRLIRARSGAVGSKTRAGNPCHQIHLDFQCDHEYLGERLSLKMCAMTIRCSAHFFMRSEQQDNSMPRMTMRPGIPGVPRLARFLAALASVLSLSSCLPPLSQRIGEQPEVRVGVVLDQPEIHLQIAAPFTLRDSRGRVYARDVAGGEWVVRPLQVVPAQVEYRLLATTTGNEQVARASAKRIRDLGLDAEIIEEPARHLPLNVAQGAGKLYRVVLDERFLSSELAQTRRRELVAHLATDVHETIRRPANGRLEMRQDGGEREFQLPSGFEILANRVTVKNVEVGAGFHWNHTEDRQYSGRMQIFINRQGNLTAVNTLPVEEYLAGVVPSEMSSGFHLEALKAQAIAARSEVLYKMTRANRNRAFDICADVACQVYSGNSRRSAETDRAVNETRGVVIAVDGRLVAAPYSAVCGGHTENNENVWPGQPQSHLRGIVDGDVNSADDGTLAAASAARSWIESSPAVFCNLGSRTVSPDLEYARKYFRWQVRYTAAELAQIIEEKTGEQIGVLRDIQPIDRGVSGRISRLRLVGSDNSVELAGELAIRQALAPATLWSSLFVIDKIPASANDGVDEFVIRGGGWGHGVGMCQIGAAMMAEQGATHEQILERYYTGVELKQAY